MAAIDPGARSARPLLGAAISVSLHALVLIGAYASWGTSGKAPAVERSAMLLQLVPPEPEAFNPPPEPLPPRADSPELPLPSIPVPKLAPMPEPDVQREPATLVAPPAPTATEWAFASTYQLKNSKGYRHTWGQQVRSMMGTAVEGPDQGMVRFRVEIAPDGRLARLETLWSTSSVAERLARQAIGNMPQWPPTPTGQPLIFERTISFTPFASDGPPLYKDDCLPDPPAHRNPFAWDGRSIRKPASGKSAEKPDPKAMEDCLRQLPQDSIEAEVARGQRMMDQWGWRASNPDR